MNKIRSIFSTILFIVILFSYGCDYDFIIPIEDGFVYAQVTKGSYWSYSWMWGDNKTYATGDIIQRNGKIYYRKVRVYSSGSYDTFYNALKDDFYYSLGSMNTKYEREVPFMKNNPRAGESWLYKINNNGIEYYVQKTILETGLIKTVKKHTFYNVVRVQTNFNNGSEISESFYAKGVGLIISYERNKVTEEINDYKIE